MTIQFIGTGSGKTSLKRFHSSILINQLSSNCLIDCGDGISRALLEQGTDYNSIDSIIITHLHPDHFSGLLTLLINMRLTGRAKNLNIYVHEKLKKFIESLLIHTNLEGIKRYFKICILTFGEDRKTVVHDSFYFIAKRNSHVTNKYGIPEHDVFYSVSLLFSCDNKLILYTADIGSGDDLKLFNENCIDYFICETTHIDIESILDVVKKFDYKHTFLTHIDDRDESRIKKSLEAEPVGAKISIAFDGLLVFL